MFPNCPKCGFDLTRGGAAPVEQYPSCGLVFRKYFQALAGAPAREKSSPAETETEERPALLARFLYVSEEVEPWRVYAGAVLLAASIFFGVRFALMDIPEWEMAGTFFHGAMVPFHEFGHLLFMPLGEFMMLAGGSFAQILMPLGFLALFALKNRDNFSAALMLWWSGTQWIDLAPYAYDAKTPQHILLTGRTGDTGAHDYIDMLGTIGLLNRAHQVAWVMHKLGILLMIVAWAWGAYLLWRQFQRRSPP